MDFFSAITSALKMIVSLDPEIVQICFISIKVSLISTLLATCAGVPIGLMVGLNRFTGRRLVRTILNTLLALPTVVIGLFVYHLLSSQGVFGDFDLLYTQSAMVIGQFVLATPIIAALTVAAVEGIDPRVRLTALTLGANSRQVMTTIIAEKRYAIIAAIIAGFSRVFAEFGISMILGGNIKGVTRNITTAIAFETGKGEFELAIALGIVLLIIAFGVNLLLQLIQKK
ncbi:MAG: ABC transporter permease [Planctomycetes bacterium]|nr:ABC transporter permease [Planctomycetota bacterium]